MILDTSAVIAIIGEEQGSRRLVEAMESASWLAIGAPTLTEVAIVLVRRFGLPGRLLLSRFLEENDVIVIPFDDRHGSVSAEAFIRYGKGRHPASLNLGDCMTYATAHLAGDPLLFVGNDFSQTDLVPAL